MKKLAPYIISCIIITCAVVAFIDSTPTEAVKYADYIAGITSALAFVWLVFGHYQNQKSIDEQKNELSQQRDAINRIAQYTLLGQIRQVTDKCIDRIHKHIDEDTVSLIELKLPFLEEALDSNDSKKKQEAASRWLKRYSAAKYVINKIKIATTMYAETEGIELNDLNKSGHVFILSNETTIKAIPHLDDLFDIVDPILTHFDEIESKYEKFVLASLYCFLDLALPDERIEEIVKGN